MPENNSDLARKYPGCKFETTTLVDKDGKIVGSFEVREGERTRHDGVDYPAGSTVKVKKTDARKQGQQ